MNDNEPFNAPKTVRQAVARLIAIMDPAMRATIAELPKEDLVSLHFGLGAAIRNGFGLWTDNRELLEDCQRQRTSPSYVTGPDEAAAVSIHPDDASMIILEALWDRLRH